MLAISRKVFRGFRFSLTPPPPPRKMVKMKVQIDDEVQEFAFPAFSKLAKNLERAGIPLEFECGYGCSCGTCAIVL